MPRVTAEHRAAMRDRIQQAAMEVVRGKGLANLTMADVITASGLSAGAIYGYYKSKDELVLDVAQSIMSGRHDAILALARRTPIPSPAEAMPELLDGVPTDWIRGGLLLQFWGASSSEAALLETARGFFTSLQEAFWAYLEAWFEQSGLSPDEAAARTQITRPAMTGLIQGYILQASIDPTLDLDTYVESATYLLGGALH